MHRRELGKDVSYSELMYYREHGLWNSEIAKLLGTSVKTVSRYIGSDGRKPGRPPKNSDNKPIDSQCRAMV